MLEEHVLECLQLGCTIDRACGVAGRTEDDGACAGCDSLLELLGSHLEILLDGGGDGHRSTLGQQYHLGIAHPVGRRDDDFITGIYQSHDGIAHALLGSVAAQNLAGQVVQAVLILQLGNYGLLQIGVAGHGRIAGPVVLHRFDGRLFDVVRRVEVGFSHAQVDYIHSLSLKLTAALAHGQCRAG